MTAINNIQYMRNPGNFLYLFIVDNKANDP